MNNSLFAVTVDCADAPALARFWADVLGRQVAEASTSERTVVLAGGGDTHEPCILFNKVAEGKTVKNRLHIDLAATDWEAEIGRLTGLGATRIRDVQENGARWITLADPEGNEFDLVHRPSRKEKQ
jgi:predicted enzyme related to lactoylglutathione lyase